uniref:Uncharacterized protein n=1 Tax=Physcomitrium patens TaxID=3218 RepID=A0A7I3Z3I7_PHYPA
MPLRPDFLYVIFYLFSAVVRCTYSTILYPVETRKLDDNVDLDQPEISSDGTKPRLVMDLTSIRAFQVKGSD